MYATEYVLLIEDHAGDARLVEAMFDDAPPGALPELRWESSARAGAMRLVAEPGCKAILLDLNLPDSTGLEALAIVLEHAEQVPIIVLSGNDDEEVGLSAVVRGAQDFLVKGTFDSAMLRRAMLYAAHRKRVEQELVRRAMHDVLTGLPTRALLLDRLRMAINASARTDARGAVLFVDLDRFKQVNDRYGHAAGDAVLRTVSARMRSVVRTADTVARVGGDEFIVLLPIICEEEDGHAVAGKLRAVVDQPVDHDGLTLQVGASIGVIEFAGDKERAETVIALADEAMYVAKRKAKAAPGQPAVFGLRM